MPASQPGRCLLLRCPSFYRRFRYRCYLISFATLLRVLLLTCTAYALCVRPRVGRTMFTGTLSTRRTLLLPIASASSSTRRSDTPASYLGTIVLSLASLPSFLCKATCSETKWIRTARHFLYIVYNNRCRLAFSQHTLHYSLTVRMRQVRMVESAEPLTSQPRSGSQSRACTAAVWPRSDT